jgi:hypothetical protein
MRDSDGKDSILRLVQSVPVFEAHPGLSGFAGGARSRLATDYRDDLLEAIERHFESSDQKDTISDDLRTVRYAIPEGNRAADDALDRIEARFASSDQEDSR